MEKDRIEDFVKFFHHLTINQFLTPISTKSSKDGHFGGLNPFEK